MFKPTLNKKTTINIIPMIDVIFVLLVFFMLFTTFRTSPTGIDMELPKAVTVSSQENENLVVAVDNDGLLYYEGETISTTRLSELASNTYQQNNQVVAIINADQDVQYKHIISVMDNLRQAGIYKLALAADKKE